ncbi:hypothetical protein RKE38_06720 [Phycicoccus sp. M110.8]|uniref:hypothetical protein n=1 Tax=Phycicoccus sp. M110.8 TaxID=3075433 RepID=UPI0028FDBE1F|nr:hypothetical protein [Phycicoccus sp. M110.8]MDU0313376.1 hypothetical protein [Phycicoccus sp. M110.8]
MAPTSQRPRRTGAAAYLPLVVAICAMVLVRELVTALWPDLSSWVAFVAALAVGWVAYARVERFLARRGKDRP